MKFLLLFLLSTIPGQHFFSQVNADLRKIVEAEHAFAILAEEKGTKDAFLAFMTDDAVVFLPDKINGKMYWNGRGESKGLLSWAPNYADISSNGILGYTTGNWEYRSNGKGDQPSAFGQFITIWLRQPDGGYKWVVDIGIGHPKPARYSIEWSTSLEAARDANEKNSSAADSAHGFYTTIAERGLAEAYKQFVIDEVRAYREDKLPILGKKQLISMVKSEKVKVTFPKRTVFFGAADLAYSTNTYTKSVDEKVVEHGNTVQIWKLVQGKWRIVLDIFKPVSSPPA